MQPMRKHFDSPAESPGQAGSSTIHPGTNPPQSPDLLQRLWNWRPPAWGSIPLSAAAAFALALVVLPSIMIAEIDVDQPQARFPQLQPPPGHYQWLLTVQRVDGHHFRASGGFVVNDL